MPHPSTSDALNRLPGGYRVIDDLTVPGDDATTVEHLVIGPTGAWLIQTASDGPDLRAAIDDVQSAAEAVAARVGTDVNPVLAVTATDAPRPARMVDRTRVVRIDALVDHLIAGPQILVPRELDQLETWARTMTVATPAEPDRRPDNSTTPLQRSTSPIWRDHDDRRRSSGPTRRRSGMAVALIFLVLLLVVAASLVAISVGLSRKDGAAGSHLSAPHRNAS